MAERIIAHFVKQWPNSTTLDRAAANSKNNDKSAVLLSFNMITGKRPIPAFMGERIIAHFVKLWPNAQHWTD